MKQLTVKTVEEALRWIDSNPHHFASVEDPKFFVLKNHHETLRIPEGIRPAVSCLIEPAGYLDARMYRPTKAGKARIRRAAKSPAMMVAS